MISNVFRAKWVMDGASTLSEAAARLEAFAAELREMERNGIQLTAPVEDDYGFIAGPGVERDEDFDDDAEG